MKNKKKRRNFDAEFKRNAVQLLLTGEKSAKDLSKNLGVSYEVLCRWKREFLNSNSDAFPGKGKLPERDEEMRKIKKELADTKMERDILKKALAIFSTPRK